MPIVRSAGALLAIGLLGFLVACGGGGGGGGSTPAPVGSKVFAADEVNGGFGSTENANPAPGSTIAITRIVSGPNTQIPVGPGCFGCLPSLALDSARDQLYVSTNTNVLVFNNAGTVTGNIAPSRMVGGTGTGTKRHLQLNTATDQLYVSTATNVGTIFRIDSASAATSTTIASRTFSVTPMLANDFIADIALDATNDVLYLALSRNTAGAIGIILGISGKASGSVPLDAEFAAGSGVTPTVAVDGPRNRLYVADFQGRVAVYDNAKTRATGAIADRTMILPFNTQHRLFLETTNDRLYASGQNRIVVINNAGSATGPITAAVAQLSTINSDLTAVVARP